MSITGAMNAAVSGLRAAARGSEIVSNNISNALTPDYGRRRIDLSPLSSGTTGGVRIDGISRHMNDGIVGDRRLASAATQNSQKTVDFFRRLEDVTGIAGDVDGLSGRLAAFEEGLIAAASRPDSVERLASSVNDAMRLANGISLASREIQDMRTNADAQIAQDVAALNKALQQVEDLNAQILAAEARGASSPALLDQRQTILNTAGSITSISIVPRDNGAIAIYTGGGAILLDITATEIGFDEKNIVTEFQTLEAGTLSGLTLNGQSLHHNALSGGSLEAYFAIRDDHGVLAQQQLDAVARDLVQRFDDPSLDTTRTSGQPGLFADAGTKFDAANEVGLSRRLVINPLVDPSSTGEIWRLRDGMGALAPGSVGDATLLNDLRSALMLSRVPDTGNFGAASQTTAGLFSSFSGLLSSNRANAEQDLSFNSARLTELTQLQLSEGVDTDQELQNLLILERSYAANARVIQAADEMLKTITRL